MKFINKKMMTLLCLIGLQLGGYTIQANEDQPSNSILGMATQEIREACQEVGEIPSSLYQLKKDFGTEVVYEVIRTKDGLGWDLAIADIIQSTPHFHKKTLETYTLVAGILEVTIDDKVYVMNPGDTVVIPLNAIHSARSLIEGKPARILVTSVPGWTPEDYHPANQ